MTLTCTTCGASFSDRQILLGRERHLHGRRQCLACRSFRPRRSPSFVTRVPPRLKVCDRCGKSFPAKMVIDGKMRSLYRRRFCLMCSAFGAHNSSKDPPGDLTGVALAEYRRRRRNDKTYRFQKKRRRQIKSMLVALRGGRCLDCGYATSVAALEFHHRDSSTKDFAISSFGGPWARLLAEAGKCDLVCANCHRMRHLSSKPKPLREDVARMRRERKSRAVALMGRVCFTCDRDGPLTLFEFHHWDSRQKDFGVSEDGIMRAWPKVLAELAKCVMLCANCHREVHAGVRELDEGLLGLAEGAPVYAA